MSDSFDFEAAEKAGHNLTHIGGPLVGITTYYCENCGAIVRLYQGDLRTFHVPKSSWSNKLKCTPSDASGVNEKNKTLKVKLNEELAADNLKGAWRPR